MRYSATTGCFYPKSENYASLPDDIIDVPHSDYHLASMRKPDESLDVINGRVVVVPAPSPTLIQLKAEKTRDLSTAFESAAKAGFVTTSGIKMDCGWDDIMRLKSAYDLSALLGLTIMPLVTDYDNQAHTNLPMADVLTMIKELGTHFQTLYAKKQTLRGQVMSLPPTATQADLDLIVWV